MASLEVILGTQKQDSRSFEGERLLIGREPTCNLQLNHPSVSRQHCVIVRKGEVYVLEDLRSSNGTFVNGRKVAGSFYLNNEDLIQVGEYTLKFQIESVSSQAMPEFEPTMLVHDKAAQDAIRKALMTPPGAPGAPNPDSPAPVAPARPPSAVVPAASEPEKQLSSGGMPAAPAAVPPMRPPSAVTPAVQTPPVSPEPPAPPAPTAPAQPSSVVMPAASTPDKPADVPPIVPKAEQPRVNAEPAAPPVSPPPPAPPAATKPEPQSSGTKPEPVPAPTEPATAPAPRPATPEKPQVIIPPIPFSPPQSPAAGEPVQDLTAPGKFDDPFDVPTMRPPPIEIESPKRAAVPPPSPLPKPPAPPVVPPLPAARPPSSVAAPPPLPPVKPSSAAALPVVPPPLPPRVAPPPPPAPPPLPVRTAPPPPPLPSNDAQAAMTMLPQHPSVPPPPPPVPPPPGRPPMATPSAGMPAYQTPHGMTPASGTRTGPIEYAGFWVRFAALVIDWIILMVPMLLVVTPISILIGRTAPVIAIPISIIMNLGILAVVCFYFAKLESGPQMATMGKRLLGIQVTDLNGQRITFMRGIGRYFAKIPSSFFAIGFIMAAFTEKKQGLHDILAGSLVIKKRS